MTISQTIRQLSRRKQTNKYKTHPQTYTTGNIIATLLLRGVGGNYTVMNTIRYDSVYLTSSRKLTGSQLSLPHGTNKKLKCETKNKMMSVTGDEHTNVMNTRTRHNGKRLTYQLDY